MSSAGTPHQRPQYGEYASPEEQRARIQDPPPVEAPEPAAPVVAETRPARPVDRIVTMVMLGYGLYAVITSIVSLMNYQAYAANLLKTLGVSADTSGLAAGRPFGVAAAIVLGVGFAITILVSLASLRRGRLTWWIPVVGAIVFNLAAGVLTLIPLMNDPVIWPAIMGRFG